MLVYDRQTKEIIKPWIAGFWQEKTDGLLRVKVQSPKITINNGLIVRNIDYLLEVEVNPEFYFKNGQAREFNISYLILVAEITSALLNCNEENAPKLSDFYNPFDTEQLSRLSDLIIGYFNQPGVIDKRLRPIKVLSFNVS